MRRARRVVSVFSRPDGDGAAWTLHAEGELGARAVRTRRRTVGVAAGRGPRGRRRRRLRRAVRARLPVRSGLPGLTAMWRRGDEVFAEVKMSQRPAGQRLRRASGAARRRPARGRPRHATPVSWRCRSPGRRCRCTPPAPRRCGRRIAPTGPSSMSIDLADGLGLPVLSVAAMVARPVSAEQLAAAVGGAPVRRVVRGRLDAARPDGRAGRPPDGEPPVFDLRPAATESDGVAGVYATTHLALERVQTVADRASRARSVVVTRGAVALAR